MILTQNLKTRITLTEPLLGTVPKDPAIYSTYIASKAPAPESGEEETGTVPLDLESKGWTGFHRDENGIFIYDYLVKGFLKEAGNVLKEALKIKAMKSKIENFVFVNPRRIYLGKEPAGYIERPLRVQTPMGERSALARSDYVPAGTSFDVEISLLPHIVAMAGSSMRFCRKCFFSNAKAMQFLATRSLAKAMHPSVKQRRSQAMQCQP